MWAIGCMKLLYNMPASTHISADLMQVYRTWFALQTINCAGSDAAEGYRFSQLIATDL